MSKSDDQRESAVRISLVDVVYGIVLAYGFNFFDQLKSPVQYVLFFFSYTVLLLDWIYVHRIYWGWEYKYNSFLLLDIASLFVMSRIIASTIRSEHVFVGWMAALFALYTAWDLVAYNKDLPCPYDWRWGFGGDFAATVGVGTLFMLGDGAPTWVNATAVIVIYFAAFATWFKLAPGCEKPGHAFGQGREPKAARQEV